MVAIPGVLHLLELAHSCCTNLTIYLWSVQEGEAAAISLLAMVQRTVEQMDAATAAQHADACYSFLLQALDTRQRKPACLESIEGVEQASVAVLLALTMKLSEAKFKPLFLRLLDWASTAPAAQPGECAYSACLCNAEWRLARAFSCLHFMFAVQASFVDCRAFCLHCCQSVRFAGSAVLHYVSADSVARHLWPLASC